MSELTEFFVRHYTLVLDNEEPTYREANHRARVVIEDSGLTLPEYRSMTPEERESEFADKIGGQIADLIDDLAGDIPMIVSEVMMHHSSDVQRGLGEHYVPEPDDMDGYLDEGEDDDECEGHESLNGADMGRTVECDGSCR